MYSTKGRYALRAMIAIGLNASDKPISLKEISNKEDISIKYLEQIIPMLVKAGLLISIRGNSGGYHLAKDARNITAGDILRCSEGALAPIACLASECNLCKRKDQCSTIELWEGLYDVTKSYLDNITLRDLIDKQLNKIGNDYTI